MGRTHADKVKAEAAKAIAGIPSTLGGSSSSGAPSSRMLSLGDLVTAKYRPYVDT